MPETLTETGLWDVDNAAYHAETDHVSHSSLSVFRESRKLYHGRYVAKTIPHPEPTAAMMIGTVVHALTLEPETFSERFAVAPKCDRRTNAGKSAWADFCAEADGRTIIDADQYDRAASIRGGIFNNQLAADLLSAAGRSECSVRWTDEASGVQCKARFDRLLGVGILVDVKTASDPSPEGFARAAYNFGYHTQAAFYHAARTAALGQDGEFLFIAVGTSEPFDCAVYQLDYDAFQLGRQKNAEALAQLAACRQANDWANPYATRLNELALPRWAYTKENFQ